MEDIRPKGAWYAVYLDQANDSRAPVVDVHKLARILPHGSGIDGNWTIHVCKNGDVTVHGEYHAMNESGYSGWKSFRFSIRRARKNEYVTLKGPFEGKFQVTKVRGHLYLAGFTGGGDASDYLYDCIWQPLADEMDIHSMEAGLTVGSENLAQTILTTEPAEKN